MKGYERPIVLGNADLAEGVYAASGCYTATAIIHQPPETGRGDYRIQVNGVHNADHRNDEQDLTLTFNQPITYKESQGQKTAGGENEEYVTIHYNYHQNETDNIGLGDVIVESEPGLAVTSTVIEDTDYQY